MEVITAEVWEVTMEAMEWDILATLTTTCTPDMVMEVFTTTCTPDMVMGVISMEVTVGMQDTEVMDLEDMEDMGGEDTPTVTPTDTPTVGTSGIWDTCTEGGDRCDRLS